jgi:hypothetical protein
VLLDHAAGRSQALARTFQLRCAVRGEGRGLYGDAECGDEPADEMQRSAAAEVRRVPMLRGRAIRATVVLLLLMAEWPTAAGAIDNEQRTVGGACGASASPAEPANEDSADWDTVMHCTSGAWARSAYFLGATSDSCDSNHAGMVQYTSGGVLEACNGTSWIPIDGGMHFISTQTASSSASLQFTNLPTSYNTLFLNCVGLLVSATNSYLELQVGEGAGPTWETGAHYTVVGAYDDMSGSGSNSPAITGGVTETDLTGTCTGCSFTTTQPELLRAYIDNIGSSSIVKNVQWSVFDEEGSRWYNHWGMSFWNNDTNPVTAIQVTVGNGNITSGTCSLYGMN